MCLYCRRKRSWNMTILSLKSLEKKENQYRSSQAQIPTFWSLLYKELLFFGSILRPFDVWKLTGLLQQCRVVRCLHDIRVPFQMVTGIDIRPSWVKRLNSHDQNRHVWYIVCFLNYGILVQVPFQQHNTSIRRSFTLGCVQWGFAMVSGSIHLEVRELDSWCCRKPQSNKAARPDK